MRLVVNCESLHPPRTGIGVYAARLLSCWKDDPSVGMLSAFSDTAQLVEVLDLTELYAADPSRRREKLISLANRIAGRWRWPYELYRAAERARFRRATARLGSDWLYFEPNFILKPFGGPAVPVIHDLSFLKFPECHPAGRVRYLEQRLPETLDRAAHVVTPSDLIRRELMKQFGVPDDRVTAIHLGADGRFGEVSRQGARKALAGFGLAAGRYILSVATAEPRKNLVRLLQAYEALPASLRQEYPMVLAGAEGWKSAEFDKLRHALEQRGEVVSLGYVADGDLPALYAGAAVFAYPSVYEGFGLPVLEAMRCGTAVLTSRDTAMVEFGAKTVKYCDPFDVDSIRAGLESLLQDAPRRENLGKKARVQASAFTWQRCADRHLEIFRRVMEEG